MKEREKELKKRMGRKKEKGERRKWMGKRGEGKEKGRMKKIQ